MRLLAKLTDEAQATQFVQFLQREGIETEKNSSLDLSGKPSIEVWIKSEDDLEMAMHWHKEFEKNPDDMRFQVSPEEIVQTESREREESSLESNKPPTQPMRERKRRRITNIIIGICVLIYGFNLMSTWGKKEPAYQFELTPSFLALIYDVPERLPLLAQFYDKYDINTYKKLENLSDQEKQAFNKVVKTPQWSGVYDYLLRGKSAKENLAAPMFIKIRKGQVYRLITPCLMHNGFIHLLFNMLWLSLLGPFIETRIKIWKYVLLTFIIGLVSNTAQYLISGPLFVGYSGVICGLAGFVLSRQRVAPWEGYPLPKSTFIFLGLYVVILLVMSVVSDFLVKFSITHTPINIANTAHIAGALVGFILGRSAWFAKEVV